MILTKLIQNLSNYNFPDRTTRDSLLKSIVAQYAAELIIEMDRQLDLREAPFTDCAIHIIIKSDQGVQMSSFGHWFGIRDSDFKKSLLIDGLSELFKSELDLTNLDVISDIEIIVENLSAVNPSLINIKRLGSLIG